MHAEKKIQPTAEKSHLKETAGLLGLPTKLKQDVLERDVTKALVARYPNAELCECDVCGFSMPDDPAIRRCPACGEDFDEAIKAEVLEERDANEVNKRLDAATAQIRAFRDDLATNAWEIGHVLMDVYDHDLWSKRHNSFAEYCEKVCGFSRTTGQDFIRLARTFSKREDVKGLSVSHLRLLAKVPDSEEREQLVEEAKKEKPTRRALAEKVKETRQRAFDMDVEANANAAKSTGKTDRRTAPVRAGKEDRVLVRASLEPGVVAEGSWQKWENGSGFTKFKIGDTLFRLEVLPRGKGFRILLPKRRA